MRQPRRSEFLHNRNTIRISFRPLREYGLKLLVLSLEQLGSVGRARFRFTGLIIPGLSSNRRSFHFSLCLFLVLISRALVP